MEALNEMLSGVDLSANDLNGDEDVMSMMQSMMESLLSKDVLYPSLQAICHKVTILLLYSCIYEMSHIHCIL